MPALIQPTVTTTPWLMCGISRGQWIKLQGKGLTPKGAYLGKKRPVWLVSELTAWLAAGAPKRSVWEAQKRNAKAS